jgi:hypothetical protein
VGGLRDREYFRFAVIYHIRLYIDVPVEQRTYASNGVVSLDLLQRFELEILPLDFEFPVDRD